MTGSLVAEVGLFVALSLRPLALIFASRPFTMTGVPAAAKVGLAAAIAFMLLPAYSHNHPVPEITLPLLAAEPLVGLILAYSVRLAFAAAELAGELLDAEAGIGLSQHFDPVSGTSVQVLQGLHINLALALYLALGGHHVLLSSLVRSYDRVPLGAVSLAPQISLQALNLAAGLFAAGVRIALPILAATTLTTVALMAATRAFPEANAFVLGLPLKLVAAVLATVALLPLLTGIYSDLFAGANAGTDRLFDLIAAR